MRRRVFVREIDTPKNSKTSDELKWIFDSLGFTSGRDTEDMSFKIMCQLLNEFKRKDIVPTEKIASSLKVDSPRVNHHLRNLMETGIIFREKRKVALRGGSLSAAIEEMRKDSERMFDRLLERSKKIDRRFGL